MRFAVVIPHFGPEESLRACLDALALQTTDDFRVYIADNSAQLRMPLSSALPSDRIRLIAMNSNRGFAAAANAGWSAGDEPWVAFLNNDAVPDPRWLEQAVAYLRLHPEIDYAASLIVRKDRPQIVDNAGDGLDRWGRPVARGRGRPAATFTRDDWILAPCGAAALVRREALADAGGFDETFFAYFEDVDLGLRLAARGRQGRLISDAVVRHGSDAEDIRFRDPRRVRWIARNRWWLWGKNAPTATLLRHGPALLIGFVRSLIHHAFVSRRLGAFMAGQIDALRGLPRILAQRRTHPPLPYAAFEALWARSRATLDA